MNMAKENSMHCYIMALIVLRLLERSFQARLKMHCNATVALAIQELCEKENYLRVRCFHLTNERFSFALFLAASHR